jgi:hypothetical protein
VKVKGVTAFTGFEMLRLPILASGLGTHTERDYNAWFNNYQGVFMYFLWDILYLFVTL